MERKIEKVPLVLNSEDDDDDDVFHSPQTEKTLAKTLKKKCKIFLVFVLITICYLVYWFDYVPFLKNHDYSMPGAPGIPVVLFWTTIFSEDLKAYQKRNPVPDLSQCAYRCLFTDDKSHASQAKLFIYHARDLNHSNVHWKIGNWQLNVFFNYESPYHTGLEYKKMPRNFFDLTLTYRQDSDVVAPYDRFEPITNETKEDEMWKWEEVQSKVKAKKKLVLQFVSNCHTPSKREAYVERLKRYIEVTSFGSCAHRDCSKTSCEPQELDNHLFYLAFENSVCKDYVTEKFWRLKNLIVPIVLDRSMVPNVIPNDTFIAVTDFSSPTELANYLHYLEGNRTEYMKYLNWTRVYKKTTNKSFPYCKLCEMAHTRKTSCISDIVNWWDQRGECQPNFGMHHLGSSARSEIYGR